MLILLGLLSYHVMVGMGRGEQYNSRSMSLFIYKWKLEVGVISDNIEVYLRRNAFY